MEFVAVSIHNSRLRDAKRGALAHLSGLPSFMCRTGRARSSFPYEIMLRISIVKI